MAQSSSEQGSPLGIAWGWRGLSLRARVTLWIVIAFSIVKITLVILILLYQRRAIHSSFDAAFAERVQIVADDLKSRVGEIDKTYLRGIALRETNNLYIQDFAVLLYDPNTREVVASYGESDDALRQVATEHPDTHHGASRYESVNGRNGVLRVATRQISLANARPVVLVVATSDRYTASLTRTVGRVLLLSTPFTIGVIALVAWFVGGIAVRPLEQVRAFAENLSPEGLGKPIDLDDSGSEVSALRKQLDAAMSRLDVAYQSQARFLANISHEIKTPISVVQSESDVLMMSRPTLEEYEAFVRSTGEEMQRLGSIVESFLLLTRVQHGESRVRRSSIDVNEIVMEAFEQCLGMARQYNVRLEPELCNDETDLSVFGDEDLLVTSLNNLVRNAIRFSPEGETVSIRCRRNDTKAMISVTDRGSGIPADLLPRLFEPFTQASSERSRGRGTGLGLQIAKGIAEIHGGDITVRNLDVGCEFTLELTETSEDDAAE